MAFNRVIVLFAMLAVFAAAVQADDLQQRIPVMESEKIPVEKPKDAVQDNEQTRAKKYAVYSTYSSYALPTYYGGYPMTSYSSSYIHKPLPYAYSAAYYPAPYYAAPYIL